MKLFSFLSKPNPGRDLALQGHEQRRARIRAVARQMRADMGLPRLKVLER